MREFSDCAFLILQEIKHVCSACTYCINRILKLVNSSAPRLQTGMYMLKTEDARHLHFHTSGFNVEVETASQFALEGTVTEVPISYRERIGKQKLSTWRDGISIMSSVFRLARDYNPAFLLRGALILNLTFSSNRRGPKILQFREASFRGSDYRRNAFSTNETDGNQDFEENPRESRLTTRFFNILKSRCTGNSGQSSIRRTQITEVIS